MGDTSKRYTPEQIVSMLREAEIELAKGQTITAVSKKLGIGDSSSDILHLYHHLHDDESEASMRALAGDHFPGAHSDGTRGTARTPGAPSATTGSH